jgi:hypothetical protein
VATVTCDSCRQTIDSARVVITTEASDEYGVNVEVTKRWVLCRACGDTIFSRIGEA